MSMKNLTPSEQRTVRIGGIGIALYLVVFFGAKLFEHLLFGTSFEI